MQDNRKFFKQKSVQIDEALFMDCIRIIHYKMDDEELVERADKELMDKFDKMLTRQAYNQFKTAPTAEERERGRRAYLNHIGMPDDYRW